MTTNDMEPPDPELAQAFEAEARFPAEAQMRQTRVWQRVQAAVSTVPLGSPMDQATSGSAGEIAASSAVSAGAGKLIVVGLVAFVAGGGSGAWMYRSWGPRPEPVIVKVPVPAVPLAVAKPEPQLLPDTQDTVPHTQANNTNQRSETARSARTSAKAESGSAPQASEPEIATSDLARERAIIDVVRTAIARGHAASALSAIERHVSEFPRGRLTEEREGLRVLALVRAGRAAEASEQAKRFRVHYPRSLLLPAIESAVPAAP